MQTAAGESTFPIMGGLVWDKSFHGMIATPIRPADVVVGKLTYIGMRLLLVVGLFFLRHRPLRRRHRTLTAILAVPAALLTGLAFAAPIAAYSATQRDPNGFNALFRFGVIPLFLFSGTFFPIEQLPELLQVDRPPDTALARRRPVPLAGPRYGGAAPDGDPSRLPRDDDRVGRRGCAHHLPHRLVQVSERR